MKFYIRLTHEDYEEIAMYENPSPGLVIMNLYTDALLRWGVLY
jgi:hypothetical protein